MTRSSRWSRRSVLAGLASIPALGLRVGAQEDPSKLVRVVVGATAGGTADFTARSVGQQLAKVLGRTVVVENRAGAAGTVAVAHVAKADLATLVPIAIAAARFRALLKTKGVQPE